MVIELKIAIAAFAVLLMSMFAMQMINEVKNPSRSVVFTALATLIGFALSVITIIGAFIIMVWR